MTAHNSAHNSANDDAGRDGSVNGAMVAGADARWVRLGPWWVSQAGLDAVAARLCVRRLLAHALVYVVLRKTYHRGQTPEQIAAYFATTFPNVVPLADEGFIRYLLAAVERPQPPEQGPQTGSRS